MCCGSRRWNALRTFVEAFQGEYKDGSNGTYDLRLFSALFFILRILALVSYHSQERFIFATLAICVLIVFIISPVLLLILCILHDCLEGALGAVDLEVGVLSTRLWKHFRESTKMEPMALVTSECFLHCSSSLEFRFYSHI